MHGKDIDEHFSWFVFHGHGEVLELVRVVFACSS